MPDTKQLRNRIKSVDSTLHLTHAMELVASSKIRKATKRMLGSGEYADSMKRAIEVLSACPSCARSPYMTERSGGRTCLVVIAGDRGLAGGYNANVFRLARKYPDAEVIPVGKRACDRWHKDALRAETFLKEDALRIAKEVCPAFEQGAYDRFGILYTKYVSMMQQDAIIRWVLPIAKPQEAQASDLVFEPDESAILKAVVPEYVASAIIACVRESFASEVAARRTAMDSAGKNARQMIDNLQLEYNRARQGAITQEITEIVAGSGS